MSLPETIRVKLSTEAAESITITPVVVREMPVRELVEYMLGVTGKNEPRIRDLLLRGTLVSGASRFRWKGWDADPAAIRDLLGAFPDPDPGLKFAPERCIRAVFRGPSRQIDLPREAAAKKPFLRRISFWDLLMEAAAAAQLRYLDYSYREHADRYSMPVSSSALLRLRDNAKLLRYTTLRDQILSAHVETVELYTQR